MNLKTEMALAKSLFGTPSASTKGAIASTAVAVNDSANGMVEIRYAGDTETMFVECIGFVQAGEEVEVIVRNGGATYVTGSKGWGDDVNTWRNGINSWRTGVDADLQMVTTDTAYITHVDTGADAGLHVHETKDGSQPVGTEPYDDGSDMWLNPAGVVLREDGQKVASFSKNLLELGYGSNAAVIDLCKGAGYIEQHVDDGRGLGLISDENIYIQAHKRNAGTGNEAYGSVYVTNTVSVPRGYVVVNVGEHDAQNNVGRKDYINIQSGAIWVDHYANTGGGEHLGHSGRIPLGVLDADVAYADPRQGGNLNVMADWPIEAGNAAKGGYVAASLSAPSVSTSGWSWRRYASGTVHCWCTMRWVVALNNSYNGTYRSGSDMYIPLPMALSCVHSVQTTMLGGSHVGAVQCPAGGTKTTWDGTSSVTSLTFRPYAFTSIANPNDGTSYYWTAVDVWGFKA